MKTTVGSMKLGKNVIYPKSKMKQETYWVITMQLMTLSFYLTWTPYALESLFTMFGIRWYKDAKIFAVLFSKIGTIVSPAIFLYCITLFFIDSEEFSS